MNKHHGNTIAFITLGLITIPLNLIWFSGFAFGALIMYLLTIKVLREADKEEGEE